MRLLVVILLVLGLALFLNPDLLESSPEVESTEGTEGTEGNETAALEEEILDQIPEIRSIPYMNFEELVADAQKSKAENSDRECGDDPAITVTNMMKEREAKLNDKNKGKELKWRYNAGRTYETQDGNLIVIGNGIYDYVSLDDDGTNSVITARNRLLGGAILEAKAAIISQLSATYSAGQYINYPESGMAPTEKLGEMAQGLGNKKAALVEKLNNLNSKVDLVSGYMEEADKDRLEGVGLGDQASALLDGIAKKLNPEYKRQELSEEDEKRYKTHVAEYEALKAEVKEIEDDIEELDKEFQPYKEAIVNGNSVEKLASQTLFGTKVVAQPYCFDHEKQRAAMMVKLVWSAKSQKRAEAVLNREKVEINPTKPGTVWLDFIDEIDKTVPTIGSFTEPDGTTIWYALNHGEHIPGLAQRVRLNTQLLAEGALAQALRSEVGLRLEAEEALITASDGSGSVTTSRFLGRLEENAKNMSLSIGGDGGYITDPDSGKKVLYWLAEIDFKSVLRAEPIIKMIEQLNTRYWLNQQIWKGKVAGMQAAGASTKDDPEAFREGFMQGAQGVLTEEREESSAELSQPDTEGQSRRWEREVDEDF